MTETMQKLLPLALALLALCACSPRTGWRLTYCDDFNGTQLDTTVWSRIGRGTADWDNTQDPKDPRLVTFRDGCIVLRGIVNDHPQTDRAPHLTGGIWSKDKHPFDCGEKGARYVVRARLHGAQGAWPAIWLMPFDNGPWPTGGEIDIMERLNHDNAVHQTVHSTFTQKNGHLRHGHASEARPGEFNEYGVDLFPDSLVFHINGKPTFTYRRDKSLPEEAGSSPSSVRSTSASTSSWVDRG